MVAGPQVGSVEVPVLPDLSSFGTLLAAGLRGSLGSVQGIFSAISKNWGLVAAAGIAAGVGSSLSSAIKYEDAFKRIDAVTNASAKSIAEWKDQILTLSTETAVAPQELADAMYYLASAGLDAGTEMGVLTVAAQGAAIGLGDTQTLAMLTAQAMNAFSDQGLTAVEVMDSLTAAVREGVVEPDQLAVSLGRILPVADALGLSFGTVVASITTMTNAGLDAYEATTALRQLLAAMAAPSVEAANAMGAIGLNAQMLRDALVHGGVIEALQLMIDKSKGNFDVLRRIIPNIRAFVGELNLSRDSMKQVIDITDQVTHAQGDLSHGFEDTKKNVAFQLQALGNSFEVLKVRAGEALLPLARQVISALNGIAPMLTVVATNADKVLAAFLLWKAMAFIPGLIGLIGTELMAMAAGAEASFILRPLAALLDAAGVSMTVFSGEVALATGSLAGLNYQLGALFTRIPVVGAAIAKLMGTTGFVGAAAAVTGVALAVREGVHTWNDYRNIVQAADDSFATMQGNFKLGTGVLDALRESSTGFAHNITSMFSAITGGLVGSDLWEEYGQKIDTVKNAVIEATKQGANLADIQSVLRGQTQAVVDVFKTYPATSTEATNALVSMFTVQLHASQEAAAAAAKNAQALREIGASGYDLLPPLQKFAPLLSAAGVDVNKFSDELIAAGGNTIALGKATDKVWASVSKTFNEATQQLAEGISFAGDALGSFVEHSKQGIETFIKNLGTARDNTKQYGKDLAEIARHGGQALVQMLVSMGTDGASAAHRIASATDTMRDRAIKNFNAVQSTARTYGEVLAEQIYGVLEDIHTLLERIASRGYDIHINDNASQVKSNLQGVINQLQAIDGSTANVTVQATVSRALGNVYNETRAVGGPVFEGRATLVGERGPELFVPNTNGKIIPNNQLPKDGGKTAVMVRLDRRHVLDELDHDATYRGW